MDAKLKQLIDANRVNTARLKTLTHDQEDFLVVCRNHINPVTFGNMVKLWREAGWGKVQEDTIRRRYQEIKTDKKLFLEICKRVGL